jgi:two-component system, OmpR family, alkaline phosphatase synthesis response regulator PhoP
MHEKVLIVEDDASMLRGLVDNFKHEGYAVSAASDGETGLSAALEGKPDLIILDIMLPKVNGYEICRLVREEGFEMPIIMLTAKGQEQDIVLGLNLGADDYVTKPFSIRELLARCNALLRRNRNGEPVVYEFGKYRLDSKARRLMLEGGEVALTPHEYDLLRYMLSRAGRALTREEILRAVWGYGILVTTRSVDRCIKTLRRKIEHDPHGPLYIKTIHGIGYRFEQQEDGEQ